MHWFWDGLIIGVNRVGLTVGVTMFLSYLMYRFSRMRRIYGVCRLGNIYFWIVAPGVACHELGHALGCWLTGTRVHKIAFFEPDMLTMTAGYVQHETVKRRWFGSAIQFIISTGPVWFGSILILLLVKLTFGLGNIVALNGAETGGLDLWGSYITALIKGIANLVPDHAKGWGFPMPEILAFYLIFCISSEMGMSSTDLKGVWRFLLQICIVIIAIHCLPGLNFIVDQIFRFLSPWILCLHLVLMVSVMMNIVLWGITDCMNRILVRVREQWGKGRR